MIYDEIAQKLRQQAKNLADTATRLNALAEELECRGAAMTADHQDQDQDLDFQELERRVEEYRELSPEERRQFQMKLQRKESIASSKIRSRFLFGEDE